MYSSAHCSCAAPCTDLACLTTTSASVASAVAANTCPKEPSPNRPPERTDAGFERAVAQDLVQRRGDVRVERAAKTPGRPVAHKNKSTASASSYSALPVSSVKPLAASSDQKPSTPARASSGSASSAAPVTGGRRRERARGVGHARRTRRRAGRVETAPRRTDSPRSAPPTRRSPPPPPATPTSRGRDPPRQSRRGPRAGRRERVARVSNGTRRRRDARHRETTRKRPSSSRLRFPSRRRRRTPRSSRAVDAEPSLLRCLSIRDASERVPGTGRRGGSRPRAARVRYARRRLMPFERAGVRSAVAQSSRVGRAKHRHAERFSRHAINQ